MDKLVLCSGALDCGGVSYPAKMPAGERMPLLMPYPQLPNLSNIRHLDLKKSKKDFKYIQKLYNICIIRFF